MQPLLSRIYTTNPNQIKELNEKHQKLKLSLDKKVKEWEKVSLSLEEIEREFN